MMMEMHVNISGHTKVDVGGNDREESPTIGTASPSSSKVVKKAKIAQVKIMKYLDAVFSI